MSAPSGFMRHVAACNNAQLPGRRVPFHVAGQPVGWVLPEAEAVVGTHVAPDGLTAAGQALVAAGLCRWRDEAFDIRADPDGPVLGQIDRGALPVLGIEAVGVHLNGLVERPDGWHVWIGRRAMDKKLDPGKLDHIVAGGVPAGLGPEETLRKEAAEEAGLSPRLVFRAVLRTVICYTMERREGLRRDRLHCYDLVLPPSFKPVPVDGEVAGFELWPIQRVLTAVRDTDNFKFNVNLVLIDLFVRLGLITDPEVRNAFPPGPPNDLRPLPKAPMLGGRAQRLPPPSGKLCQSFQNKTDRPLFINLELATSRFRLGSGEELLLYYDPADLSDELDASLRIEYIQNGPNLELVVWTSEMTMFRPDGSKAEQNFALE